MSAVLIRRSLLSLSVLAVLSAGLAAPAWAQDPPRERTPRDRGSARSEAPAGRDTDRAGRARGDTLADSVRRFERSRGGRVLSAERMQSDGRDVNRIKAMDENGRVRVFVDDPQQRQPQPQRRRTRDGDD